MATSEQAREPAAQRLDRDLMTEAASRLRDPFESHYLGVLRTQDPLLLERGNGGVAIYRDLKRDGAVFSAMQKRVLALISRPWQVEPVEESGRADAAVLTQMLKRLPFDQLCRDLMEAVLIGQSICEVVWTIRDGQVVPDRLPQRAPHRFVYVQDNPDQPPTLHLLTREEGVRGVPLPERKFIVHRVNPEDDNPYGTGLGLQLYWPVYFKRAGIVAWNKLNDRFGTPTLWGRYPREAGKKEKDTLFEALRAFSLDGVVMTPEGALIDLIEGKLSGNVTTQQALCEYMDDWVSSVILGTEPRSKSGGAMAAASKERADVRLDLVQADSDLLSDTLNNSLIRWLCELNGLAPCQVYRVIKEEEDLRAIAEADRIVSEMGFALSIDQVRAKYGEGWEVKAAPDVPAAPEEEATKAATPGEAAKYDASMINAYSMGIDRLARLGMEVPVDFVRDVFSIPRPSPGQALLVPASPTEAPGPQFAEAPTAPKRDDRDVLTDQLAQATADPLRGWIEQLREMVTTADSLEQLRDRLLAAYGDLDTETIAAVMELAFGLAAAQGHEDVAREAGML